MSADVWIEREACATCGRGEDRADDMNLTYNLTPMLRAAGMPPWRDFMGMRARAAGAIWQRVVDELRSDRERFEAMNPPNGWGSYEQAVEVLTRFAAACLAAGPNDKIGGWL